MHARFFKEAIPVKIGIESNLIKYLFQNVRFITGTAYAGKSTMVRLLAERHDGVFCGENYHDRLMDAVDPAHQPNLTYLRHLTDWQQFIHRSPEAYRAWLDGVAREATDMEILLLTRLSAEGRKVFVDTNIPLDILREISDRRRVLVMLSPQSTSVDRFFDRNDPEKQFILRQIEQAPDPEAALRNFRACVALANSRETYDAFLHSGFQTLIRDDSRTIDETLALVERHFMLA